MGKIVHIDMSAVEQGREQEEILAEILMERPRGTVTVYVNGMMFIEGSDYKVTGGTVEFLEDIPEESDVQVMLWDNKNVLASKHSFTI
jgi:hypothetical protein